VTVARCEGGTDIVNSWLGLIGQSDPFRKNAVCLVARAAGASESVVRAAVDSHTRDAHLILERAGAAGPPEALACSILGRPVAVLDDPITALGEFLAPMQDQCLLAVVDPNASTSGSDLQLIAQLAGRYPSIVAGVALTEELARRVFSDVRSRWQALLAEGVVAVTSSESVPIPQGLPQTALAARRDLIAQGASTATIREFDAIALARPDSMNARSQYESLLFGILSGRLETIGLFRLNERLGFKFRKRFTEVDICSRVLGLAIEIDGEYHRNPKNRQRDREKDALLREHGYVVLRFDTDELTANLNSVVSSISKVVRERKQKLWEKTP